MVQSFNYDSFRPNYSAVKINIKKPEVNVGDNRNTYIDDNGIYNAVNIEIDNPTVNATPKKVYDYPTANELVTYDMLNPNQVSLPQGFNLAYTTTNVILPNAKQESDLSNIEESEIADTEADIAVPAENNSEFENLENDEIADSAIIDTTEENPDSENIAVETSDVEPVESENIEAEAVEVPAPNYTTVDAEKGDVENLESTEVLDSVSTPEIMKPEIIPGEEIKPDVDIPLVISNLTNADYDIQAQQMEEIARIALDDKENAIPYIVREVFTGLIDIAQQDTTNLAAPSEKQVEARKKLITNFLVMENAKNNNVEPKLPYQLTEEDLAAADELSPLEMAERNKEYALYTIAILAKIYTDEIETQTGNVVPLTDLPGSAAIVDALRHNPNAGVKVAAIDALAYIHRPEYNEELNTLFTLAQTDTNSQVAQAAERAINRTNK